MALPLAKLVELQALVNGFKACKRASKRQLQHLAGKFNWACRVVYGGRTFLHRILDTINQLAQRSAQYQLTFGFYADIQWWCDFLLTFNGKRLFLNQKWVWVETDACPVAAGVVCEGDWLYYNFGCESPALSAMHINHKETWAVYLAAEHWAPCWANRHVIVSSDNQAAVGIINKGSTGSPIIMQALRCLFWLSAVYNFRITAKYIPGQQNGVADAVSRLHSLHHLLYFWQALIAVYGPSTGVATDLLVNHMPYQSSFFLFCRYSC